MKPVVSVIVPTHNPHPGRLQRTMEGLASQEMDHAKWELIIIDNASSPGKSGEKTALEHLDLSWHKQGRIVREDELGLTHARLRGIAESTGDFLIFCDDDNILREDYLEVASNLLTRDGALGVVGGKSIPEYEVDPPDWFTRLGISLGVRDLGDEPLVAQWNDSPDEERSYPRMAPIGAGMCFRREVAELYVDHCAGHAGNVATDRKGDELVSGGDNDLVMTALENGWRVGYEPTLQLTHLIPEGRLKKEYLAKLNHDSTRSWVLVLDMHGIRPWKPIPPSTLPLRKGLSYLRRRAWKGPEQYIRWRGGCGLYEGAALLSKKGNRPSSATK